MQKRRTVESFESLIVRLTLGIGLFALGFVAVPATSARPAQADLKDEHDPAKRSERCLQAAETAFDSARSAYTKDDIHSGNADLDEMMAALNNCVSALDTAHKSRLYKRAEMRVSSLQRRLQNLLDDISVTERGWAEQTGRKLEEIHDKLLEGAMKK